MKRLYTYLSGMVIGVFIWMAGALPAGATDVWVDHWDSENVDVYVMDDTISYGTRSTGRWFKVSTKLVQDGQLQQVVDWEFSKYKSDMWRYETNTMDGTHTTVVIVHNGVFEYSMKQIGWSYYIRNGWYYY